MHETMDSLIRQTIGFKQNIQVIFVNDVSSDGSATICRAYQQQYPDNITYVELQENQGPAGARKAGIPYIQGKYINFLDSDDYWEKDAYEKAVDFLESHCEEIDLVSCRVHNFEAWSGWHALDYVFSHDRVVDILNEYDAIKTMITSVLFKSEIILQEDMDISFRYGEDAKFVTQVILRKGKYGVLRSAVFWYRRHYGEDSISQVIKGDSSYYFDVLERLHLDLHLQSQRRFGRVIPFVQFIDAYYLQWRILETPDYSIFSQHSIEKYRSLIVQVLQEVEDYIICSQRHIWKEHKLFLFSLKYQRDIRKELERHENALFFHNLKICSLVDSHNIELENVKIKQDVLHLQAKCNLVLPRNKYRVFAIDDHQNRYLMEFYELDVKRTRRGLGIDYHKFWGLRVAVPLSIVNKIQIGLEYDGVTFIQPFSLGLWFPLTDNIGWSHHEIGPYMIRVFKGERSLLIRKNVQKEYQKAEQEYQKQLFSHKHRRMWLFRKCLQPILRRKQKSGKQIWLFADRIFTADDNAEYLFHYVLSQHNPNIEAYYVLSKNSPDYERVAKIGKVVTYKSVKFYILFTISDFIISSIMDQYFYKSFDEHHEYIKDMFHSKWIYLQHCVNKDELTGIYHKFVLNMDRFITSAIPEDHAMRSLPYGYSDDEIQLLGMPRYDVLYPCRSAKPQKLICIAPTWRFNLTVPSGIDQREGRYPYSEKFKESPFFQFYNSLLNDPRLLEVMHKHGYCGMLRLHPAAGAQICDFNFPDVFSPYGDKLTYQDQFYKCALLVTDYSSIAMDYAFVGRAVIYAQFDSDTFYHKHIYQKGYFDYERDGFGPVCHNYESTLTAIIQAIERDCTVEPRYQARVNQFFAYQDQNNCKRIYETILDAGKE